MPLDRALVDRFYARAQAARWRVSIDDFAAALDRSATAGITDRAPGARTLEQYLGSLHLEDLALACACAAGDEGAWDHFVLEHRPFLYRAADALDPAGGARELADSLYADLFGLRTDGGSRASLFRYFHGRSKLTTWLRAVLAQRFVDRVRVHQKTEPLPEDDSPAAPIVPMRADDGERDRDLAVIREALLHAVAGLDPRDRLRLGCYYAQGLTLAETGRLIGEHEATASRHLAGARRRIRQAVEDRLRTTHGLADAEIVRAFSSVVNDAGTLDLEELLAGPSGRKPGSLDRSNQEDVP